MYPVQFGAPGVMRQVGGLVRITDLDGHHRPHRRVQAGQDRVDRGQRGLVPGQHHLGDPRPHPPGRGRAPPQQFVADTRRQRPGRGRAGRVVQHEVEVDLAESRVEAPDGVAAHRREGELHQGHHVVPAHHLRDDRLGREELDRDVLIGALVDEVVQIAGHGDAHDVGAHPTPRGDDRATVPAGGLRLGVQPFLNSSSTFSTSSRASVAQVTAERLPLRNAKARSAFTAGRPLKTRLSTSLRALGVSFPSGPAG